MWTRVLCLTPGWLFDFLSRLHVRMWLRHPMTKMTTPSWIRPIRVFKQTVNKNKSHFLHCKTFKKVLSIFAARLKTIVTLGNKFFAFSKWKLFCLVLHDLDNFAWKKKILLIGECWWNDHSYMRNNEWIWPQLFLTSRERKVEKKYHAYEP